MRIRTTVPAVLTSRHVNESRSKTRIMGMTGGQVSCEDALRLDIRNANISVHPEQHNVSTAPLFLTDIIFNELVIVRSFSLAVILTLVRLALQFDSQFCEEPRQIELGKDVAGAHGHSH